MPLEPDSPGSVSIGENAKKYNAHLRNSTQKGRFISKYRTEFAACIGSVVSTFITVGSNSLL